MTRRPQRGLTLIEMLVSLAIGMVLVAMGTSALMHVSKLFTRNIAHIQAHHDAATIQQRLAGTLESLYHPALIECRADPGPDGVWGSGDETVELTWMSSLRSLDDGTMSYGPTPMHDLLWHRMRWQGDGEGGGDLSFASSTGRRVVPSWTNTDLALGPFVRRDRRRDLDDNDLRFLPGMDLATYSDVAVDGDGSDLDQRLLPWHPPSTRIASCTIELVDHGGYTVRSDPTAGVVISSPSGATVPSLMTEYSTPTVQVLDGTWLDGRRHVPADVSPAAATYHRRSTSSQRPALIRISFELIMTTPGEQGVHDHAPRLPFAITICPSLALPPL